MVAGPGGSVGSKSQPYSQYYQDDPDVHGPAFAGFNTLDQGAGQLNVAGAVAIAKLVRSTSSFGFVSIDSNCSCASEQHFPPIRSPGRRDLFWKHATVTAGT